MVSFLYTHPIMLLNAHRTMQCPVCSGALITSKDAGMSVSVLDVTDEGNVVLAHTHCVIKVNGKTQEGDAG